MDAQHKNSITINGITYVLKRRKGMPEYGDGYVCRDCGLEKICNSQLNICMAFDAQPNDIFVVSEDSQEILNEVDCFSDKNLRKAVRRLVTSATKQYEDALRINNLLKQIVTDT